MEMEMEMQKDVMVPEEQEIADQICQILLDQIQHVLPGLLGMNQDNEENQRSSQSS